LEDLESEAFVTLMQKGLNTLRQRSLERGDVSSHEYLATGPGCVKVHVSSDQRRKCVLSTDVSDFTHEVPVKKLWSSCDIFQWKTHCFYCGMPAVVDSRYPDRAASSVASTIPFTRPYVGSSSHGRQGDLFYTCLIRQMNR